MKELVKLIKNEIKMKRPNITGRDLKIFFLGMFIMFLFEVIINWHDFSEGVRDGFNATRTDRLR